MVSFTLAISRVVKSTKNNSRMNKSIDIVVKNVIKMFLMYEGCYTKKCNN